MDANDEQLLEVLQSTLLMEVPIFQRNYSWTEDHCQQLWDDIHRAGRDSEAGGRDSHFLGTVVLVREEHDFITRRQIVDGQQRLTTMTLLLSAMVEHLSAHSECNLPGDITGVKIRNYYIVNSQEEGERFRRIHLSQSDEAVLDSIIGTKENPAAGPVPKDWEDRPLWKNFKFFQRKFADCNPDDVKNLWKGIRCIKIILTNLERKDDDPQLVFESMNSTGLDLTQSDLIRNFVLMGLDSKDQVNLYNKFWRPMEQNFAHYHATEKMDSFVRHFLTLMQKDIPKKDEVYGAFKEYARDYAGGIQSLLSELLIYSQYFKNMEFEAEPDDELRAAFEDISRLKVDVAYPLLLRLYDDYKRQQVLGRDDFTSMVRLIESYVFRRIVCGVPTGSHNNTFASLAKAMQNDNHLECLKAKFQLMESYRSFPSDERFADELRTRDMYELRSKLYWLGRFENHKAEARADVSNLTVEHIMPQNPKLNQQWQDDLGANWQDKQRKHVNRLGNLTLTGPGYNAKYSDLPFLKKRDMEDGFVDSGIRLSYDLRNKNKWNVKKIEERTKRMATTAISIWPSPDVADGVLEQYRKTKDSPEQEYTIDDHPRLKNPPLSHLFQVFREEVLLLDSVVTERFRKNVVSYSADVVFVRVRAQKQQLRVEMPVALSDVDDPQGLCRERTFRNGSKLISIAYKDRNQLRYIVNIVEQALRVQIG